MSQVDEGLALESVSVADAWALLWCRNQGAFHVCRLLEHLSDTRQEFLRDQWFDQWVLLDVGTEASVRSAAARYDERKCLRFDDDAAAGRVVEHL